MKRFFIFLLYFIVIVFAIVGFVLLAAYFGVNLHLTNAEGIVDQQTEVFWNEGKVKITEPELVFGDTFFSGGNYCLLQIIKNEYPGAFRRITNLALTDQKDLAQDNLDALSSTMDFSSVTNTARIQSCQTELLSKQVSVKDFKLLADMVDSTSPFAWASSTEWTFFKSGAVKDQELIKQIEAATGIKGRVLVSQLAAEQMRLFYSDRAWFEQAISPIKMLASMSQFSWGVLGLKQETAQRIEKNLKDKESVFYLGSELENILNFKTKNINQERFQRVTNYKDHYYAYLYAALFNKQIISQWQKAGIDISKRPEILATLYNIGFARSQPNPNPQMGGAELKIGDRQYSFGRLAYEFYYSDELIDEFPQ